MLYFCFLLYNLFLLFHEIIPKNHHLSSCIFSCYLQTPQQSAHEEWGDLDPVVNRGDTLDRNPLCVDPYLVGGNIVKPEHDQPNTVRQQEEEFLMAWNDIPGNMSGPSSETPCYTDFEGDCNFSVTFGVMNTSSTRKTKHWDVSNFH